jgi:hypothetical protein
MTDRVARRYLIVIKDVKGKSLFQSVAHWDEKEREFAIAEIARLDGLPDARPARRPRPRLGGRAQPSKGLPKASS